MRFLTGNTGISGHQLQVGGRFPTILGSTDGEGEHRLRSLTEMQFLIALRVIYLELLVIYLPLDPNLSCILWLELGSDQEGVVNLA